MTVEKKMELGNRYFQQEKYNKAIPYFTDVAFERNSSFTLAAQEKLADSYYLQNNYTEARFEYEEISRLFPDYENIDKIFFRIGICFFKESLSLHYTQESTMRAIQAFESFIEKFPFSEKKAEALEYIKKCNEKLLGKKFYNGYTYFKIYDYPAALMYFKEIIEQDMNNEYDRKALYYSAMIYSVREDKADTIQIANRLIDKYPDSKEAMKARKLIEKIED